MDEKSSQPVDLDLDALISGTKSVRLNGKILQVNMPDVLQLLELNKHVARLQGLKDKQLGDAEALAAIQDFKAGITKLIPQIEGETLSLNQLLGLLDFIVAVSIPKTPGNADQTEGKPQKKTELNEQVESSSSSSPDSSTTTQGTQPLVS